MYEWCVCEFLKTILTLAFNMNALLIGIGNWIVMRLKLIRFNCCCCYCSYLLKIFSRTLFRLYFYFTECMSADAKCEMKKFLNFYCLLYPKIQQHLNYCLDCIIRIVYINLYQRQNTSISYSNNFVVRASSKQATTGL